MGLGESAIDLGLLVEYLYDDNNVPGLVTAFDDDIFLGTRFAFNDTQSTELLLGGSFDLNQQTQIDQFSLDLQATKGSWLLKLEALTRDFTLGRNNAATGGFEYTLVGLGESAIDLSLLVEYLYDNNNVPGLVTAFDDDIFLGTRFAFNDTQSTELLLGGSFDLNQHSNFFNIEGSRRIGQTWKAELEVRIFDNDVPTDPFFALRDDDHVRLIFSKYF